jgi:phosphatidylglycerol:prolipoprotein diacylglycerol transferase
MPLPLAYWVDNLPPFLGPHWGKFGIHYYGLAYVLGFVVAFGLLMRYARAGRSQLPAGQVEGFIVAVVLGVYVGGRLGSYFLYDGWRTFRADPLFIFRVWEGGMASHGGFIGVAVALAWYARTHKIPFLHLGDLIVSTAPAGLLFGRLANFINGELWGKVTTVPWAVIFPLSARPGTPLPMILPRHPSQLYEAALEGALLLALVQWRFWRTDVVRTCPGRLSGEFFIAYALVRMFGEIFREPDEGVSLVFGLSRGTFYSIFLLGIGAWLVLRRPPATTPNPG